MDTGTRRRLREEVAAEVRAKLARERISGSELARQLGWSQSYTTRRLDGRIALDLDDLERIADALGVTVHDLIPRTAPIGSINERLARAPKRSKTKRIRVAHRPAAHHPNDRPTPATARPQSAIPPTRRRPTFVRPPISRVTA